MLQCFFTCGRFAAILRDNLCRLLVLIGSSFIGLPPDDLLHPSVTCGCDLSLVVLLAGLPPGIL